MDAWYSEVKDFTFCSASNDFLKVGHYTQVRRHSRARKASLITGFTALATIFIDDINGQYREKKHHKLPEHGCVVMLPFWLDRKRRSSLHDTSESFIRLSACSQQRSAITFEIVRQIFRFFFPVGENLKVYVLFVIGAYRLKNFVQKILSSFQTLFPHSKSRIAVFSFGIQHQHLGTCAYLVDVAGAKDWFAVLGAKTVRCAAIFIGNPLPFFALEAMVLLPDIRE